MKAATQLLFVHGVGASDEVWRFQLERLQQPQLQAINLPGHAGAQEIDLPEQSAPLELYANHLVEVIDSLDCSQVLLIGHQLGAAVAAIAATAAPKVCGLFAISLGLDFSVSPVLDALLERSPHELLNLIVKTAFGPKTDEILMQRFMHYGLATSPAVLARDLAACRAWRGQEFLPQLQVPVFYLTGREDGLVPPLSSEAAALHTHRARAEFLEDIGHFAMLEHPRRVNELIANFLTYLDSL